MTVAVAVVGLLFGGGKDSEDGIGRFKRLPPALAKALGLREEPKESAFRGCLGFVSGCFNVLFRVVAIFDPWT